MYKVIPTKGKPYVVNENHVLCLKATKIGSLSFSEKEKHWKLLWQERNEFGYPMMVGVTIMSVWLYQFAYESPAQRFLNLAPVRIGAVIMMILYLAVCVGSTGQAFIYNQF